MAHSHALTKHLLKHLLPDLSKASAETLEIVTDVEQISTLLASLAEVKTKEIVPMEQAFLDLQ